MISVFGSDISQTEIDNVIACMKSQWIGFGEKVTLFEKAFSEKFDVPHFAMVDSGSNALLLAVKLLNLPEYSEIIVPSFTWVSCAQAVLMAGHVPVFCDVDIDTMNVRREDIEKKLNPRVKAIMVVHYAGLSVDLDPIIDLGFPIIEDAAHAVNSTYKGKHCGAITDVGIFSFDAVKNLTAGEGGGISARNPELISRAKILRYCGIGKSGFETALQATGKNNRWWEYSIQESFIKMLPNNINAAIGLAQLERIDALQQYRARIWKRYQEEFSSTDWISTPHDAVNGDTHSYFTYCIRVPKRDELARFLLGNDVYTTLRYHPLHLNPIFKHFNLRLPNAEKLNAEGLNIPLHPRLSDGDVDKIVSLVKTFGRKNSL
ncbi:MAG: DegT/DnrJ/EryC1/StrS aminotransferase family protein [Bacteroidales bacterium]|jgi:dTDP-4-amino-4,6-dideoxygalactose transaminase|nr:DegT/DnrJ/EryC1/StrS aminotransferase family protein [Bacteroidales bacterium]